MLICNLLVLLEKKCKIWIIGRYYDGNSARLFGFFCVLGGGKTSRSFGSAKLRGSFKASLVAR